MTIKGIVPPKIDSKKTASNILKALDEGANVITKDYNKTIATWNDPPKFVTKKTIGKDAIYNIYPSGSSIEVDKYVWTDLGTKPHTIVPKKAPSLLFRPNFTAKTKPKVISSGAGGSSGPIVGAKKVNHPGTKPRLFSITIRDNREKLIVKNLHRVAIP